ncbi:MAG TPA: hypothetical protein VLJ80_06125 [Solirubrobacteraceae bacterium]|nr:hypothetical protein [Solirubrobacteraceae bacterium]
MKRVGLTGMAAMWAVAATAVAASPAVAALPEFSNTGITFSGTAGAGTLETKSGTKVTCTAGKSTGTITGVKTVSKIVITETGCKSSGFACQTPKAASGELVTTELTGTLGDINASKKEVGVKLAPTAGGKFIEFECVGGIIKVQVTGSGICPVTPINTETTKFNFTCKQVKGVQAVTRFEGEKEESLLKTSIGGGPAEQSADECTTTITGTASTTIKR